jgi:hypothetical protein
VFEQPAEQDEQHDSLTQPAQQKKRFVEPVVSAPVDVLEATSFFLQSPTVTSTSTT